MESCTTAPTAEADAATKRPSEEYGAGDDEFSAPDGMGWASNNDEQEESEYDYEYESDGSREEGSQGLVREST